MCPSLDQNKIMVSPFGPTVQQYVAFLPQRPAHRNLSDHGKAHDADEGAEDECEDQVHTEPQTSPPEKARLNEYVLSLPMSMVMTYVPRADGTREK